MGGYVPKADTTVNYCFVISIPVDIKQSIKVDDVDYAESGNIILHGLEDLYEVDIPLTYNLDVTYSGQYVSRVEFTFNHYVAMSTDEIQISLNFSTNMVTFNYVTDGNSSEKSIDVYLISSKTLIKPNLVTNESSIYYTGDFL